MRIFFHIDRGDQIASDREGQLFESVEDARCEAIHSAREIMAAGLLGGYPTFHFTIRATDEADEILFILPFEDAIPR